MTEDSDVEMPDTPVAVACVLALIINGGVCLLCTLVLTLLENALNSGPYSGLVGLLYGINGIVVYQFFYLVPWWLSSAKKGHHKRALGIKIAAVVTCLIVGGCWATMSAR